MALCSERNGVHMIGLRGHHVLFCMLKFPMGGWNRQAFYEHNQCRY